MTILSLIFSTLITGIVGLLSFVVAGYLIAMLCQVAIGLWKRHKERQQSPFQLIADEYYRPLAEIRQDDSKQPGDEFKPLYVKAGNK